MSSADNRQELPDVASAAHPDQAGALDWVGMDGIDLPVRYADGQGGTLVAPARVSVQVDLADPDKRAASTCRACTCCSKRRWPSRR